MYILECMEDLIVWSIKVIVWMMDVTCLIEGHHPLLVGVTVGPLLPVPAENFEGIVCPPIHLLTDDWQLLLTIQKGVSTKLLRLLTKHLSQNENKSFIRSWDTQERRRGGVGYCNKHYGICKQNLKQEQIYITHLLPISHIFQKQSQCCFIRRLLKMSFFCTTKQHSQPALNTHLRWHGHILHCTVYLWQSKTNSNVDWQNSQWHKNEYHDSN